MARRLASAAVDNPCELRCPAEHIGAGIDRMPEDLQHSVIGGRPPPNLADAEIAPRDRQLQRCIVCPEQNLSCAAQLLKLLEQEPNDAADPFIRVDLDLTDLVPAIPRRKTELELAPQRLRIPCSQPTLAQQAQFVF